MKKQATQISLEKEVTLLRSFVIGTAGKDREGHYKPEFVDKILNSLEHSPKHQFKDSASFLEKLNY